MSRQGDALARTAVSKTDGTVLKMNYMSGAAGSLTIDYQQ